MFSPQESILLDSCSIKKLEQGQDMNKHKIIPNTYVTVEIQCHRVMKTVIIVFLLLCSFIAYIFQKLFCFPDNQAINLFF